MRIDLLRFGWVDLLTVIVLILGIIRGRKRGLSEELLDTLQWVAMVVAGGLLYQSAAQSLGQGEWVGLTCCRIAAYLVLALLIKLPFSLVKRRLGEKVVGGDTFGKLQDYLGMQAGMLRCACIYVFLLSLLHAPYYSPEELAANAKYQEKNFGDIRFPTVGSVQHTVFKESVTGQALERFLGPLLIASTPSGAKDLRNDESLAKRREHSIDVLIGRK